MMIKLTHTLYAVGTITDCIYNICISKDNILSADTNNSYDWQEFKLKLPDGNWQLLGTVTHDAIDFDCEPYCENYGIYGYRNYDTQLQYGEVLRKTPEGSFRSLLTSKGCDLTKKYVIVKIKKYK